MQTRITIETSLDRASLLELRDRIDELLGGTTAATSERIVQIGSKEAADRKVSEIWSRVGENTKRLLVAAATEWPSGDEFSMNDLARVLDRDPKTVRSWHRNLGRTLKQVDVAVPEPEIFMSRWDGERNIYKMSVAVRDAIIEYSDPSWRA